MPYKTHQNTAVISQGQFDRYCHRSNNRRELHKGDKTRQDRAYRVVHQW